MINRSLVVVEGKKRYAVLFMYAGIIVITAFFLNTPSEIFSGLKDIVLSPSILLTDYISVGNLGAAFFNSGFLMLVSIFIAKLNNVIINGPIIASIFTIGGFAFFGKNIYNIWGIIFGVYLYSLVQGENFNKFIIIAFFGTSLAPMISQISFGFDFHPVLAIFLSNILGVLGGYLLPPLANHFITFHQGFNLYNIGFTAGVVGTIFMSIFRSFGLNTEPLNIISEGNNTVLGIYFTVFFLSMIIIGFVFNNKSFKGYKNLLKFTGRLVSDFVGLTGFGLSLINMGILGILSILYVFLVKGDLNGPIIGGIFTVVGFGAFGKHPKNVIPIIIGVYLATIFNTWEPNSTAVILAALFGTSLAPISGNFGWKCGIIAGMLHLSMVMNIGYLHGGINLYNNGFSAGLVAGILGPIIDSFRKG